MYYKSLKVKDLREILKSRGLKGWSKLKKDDLISFIIGNEEYPTGRATEDARDMSKKTIRELNILARIYDVKIRPKANKNEIIYLLGENYGERRRVYFERKIGSWESKIRANEEQMQWDQETQEEEAVLTAASDSMKISHFISFVVTSFVMASCTPVLVSTTLHPEPIALLSALFLRSMTRANLLS